MQRTTTIKIYQLYSKNVNKYKNHKKLSFFLKNNTQWALISMKNFKMFNKNIVRVGTYIII